MQGRIVSGTLIALVGLLLLLGNFGLLPEGFDPFKLWPLLIVAWGVRTMVGGLKYSRAAR